MKQLRTKYHSTIPLLYIHKKEYLLPKAIKDKIPHSTIATWRNTPSNSYYGQEFEDITKEAFESYELLLKYQQLKKMIQTFDKAWLKISEILVPILKKKQHKTHFIELLQTLHQVVPRKKILKLVKISPHQYTYLINGVKEKCGISVLNRCFKKHPNQLSLNEIENIKELYQNPSYKTWPSTSIFYKGLRDNKINCSLATFYKYVRLLGLKRVFKKPDPNWKGCKSSKPNEYLHVDTTYQKLPSAEKAAIVLVSDNYSRAILGYNIATKNGANFVRNALAMSVKTYTALHIEEQEQCTLVADGGAENHAACIDEYISLTKVPLLKKVRALVDVSFSNSPIEAINKIIKRYIRHHKPQSISDLEKLLPSIIEDYNTIRPHASLKGLTPMEAYTNASIIDFSNQLQTARKLRIKQNTKKCCFMQ